MLPLVNGSNDRFPNRGFRTTKSAVCVGRMPLLDVLGELIRHASL